MTAWGGEVCLFISGSSQLTTVNVLAMATLGMLSFPWLDPLRNRMEVKKKQGNKIGSSYATDYNRAGFTYLPASHPGFT